MAMKFSDVEQHEHKQKKPGDDVAIHPFVNAFANIGAIMGRDLGVVALRAIENQRGGMGAVLFWSAGQVPDSVLNKLPDDMKARLYGAMLVPLGASIPGFLFQDVEVEAAKVTIADGSQLVAFVRK